MADIDKIIDKKISQAIVKYGMIKSGDRILVAVSGGKDSMSLVYHLMKKMRSDFPIKFDLHAIHIKTDFCNCGKKTRMETYLGTWDVPYTILPVPVIARLKPGKKMNCYWCSTQRRMELMRFAEENGYNKIALGHHMDDILETFFMNMSYKGELSTMLPVLKYDRYALTVIRPLALVKEQEVIEFATENDLNKLVCTCPYGKKSKRKDMRAVINEMADGAEYIRDNIYKALSNPVQRYMVGSPESRMDDSDNNDIVKIPDSNIPGEEKPKAANWMQIPEEEDLTGNKGNKPCDLGKDCPEGASCAVCGS